MNCYMHFNEHVVAMVGFSVVLTVDMAVLAVVAMVLCASVTMGSPERSSALFIGSKHPYRLCSRPLQC